MKSKHSKSKNKSKEGIIRIVGDQDVGKSSIIYRFIYNSFISDLDLHQIEPYKMI